MLEIRLLGAFELKAGGQPVDIPSRLAQSLLAYLILNRVTPHRREKLAGIFWPDVPEERARASLRHELWRIRKTLASAGAADSLLADDLAVAFAPASPYALDVACLEQLTDDASIPQLVKALAAYRGELLPGFYDDWLVVEREHLQFLFEQRLARLLQLLEQGGCWSEMIEWAERWLSFGQNPDAAYRALMVAYTGLGDRVKALATYDRCVGALARLGLQPSDELKALKRLHEAPPKPSVIGLPVPLTSFVSRQREIQDVSQLLLASRLVTLTGAGGVGKTRLAVEVARRLVNRFPGGVCYLELAPLRDSSLIPAMLIGLLRVPAGSGEPQSALDLLIGYFQPRHALLILDNCEHLLDACAQLTHALLVACPALRILVTSREPLRAEGEVTFRVPSLDVPAWRAGEPLPDLLQAGAIQLFVERAAARQPGFALSPSNAPSILQICSRLDGIPMAIELAAGRLDALTVESILGNLNDRFAILTQGLRTDLPRHQTLRALIDWSYELLSTAEQSLFRRLSVFAGGWTLDSARCVAAHGILRENDVLGLLPGLVEKSLVDFDAVRGRYAMRESVREYALDLLTSSGESELFRNRHLDYFLERAEASNIASRESDALSEQLAPDSQNLLAALEWCETAAEGAHKALQLIGAARMVFGLLAQYELGYDLVRKFLAMPGAQVRDRVRWRALLTLSQAAFFTGHAADVAWSIEESLSIARELGDARGEALALWWLSSVAAGDFAAALHYLDKALHIAEQLGLQRLVLLIRHSTAERLRLHGDFDAAEAVYAEVVAAQRRSGVTYDFLASLMCLAAVSIQKGNLPPARQHSLEALELMRRAPYGTRDAGYSLGVCASFLSSMGDYAHAAILFGAAARQDETYSHITEPVDARLIQPMMEQTCRALGDPAFQSAFAEGRRLSADEAVAQAEAWLRAA